MNNLFIITLSRMSRESCSSLEKEALSKAIELLRKDDSTSLMNNCICDKCSDYTYEIKDLTPQYCTFCGCELNNKEND